ncbi:hypothetical protein NP493_563g03012 [Ridgeia piscesae]|uniref:Uncharacterized protein n=1 Tax=Ridgeia piscesae TaxID=27915 RepID=A0AAD9NRI6_RIDPI|nr:hypothetical protein NP493_563g03012 [Ridgeia piscesae]
MVTDSQRHSEDDCATWRTNMASATCFLCYVLFTMAALLVTAFVHLVSWFDIDNLDFFGDSLTATWATPKLNFVKVEWLVYVWTVVYALQLAWLVYSTELVVTRTGLGPLYARPAVLPPSVFVVFFAALAFTVGWLCLWTTPDLHRYSSLCMLGASACAYVTLAIAVNALRKHGPALLEVGARQPVAAINVFVFNGVAVFACWTTILLLWSALSVTVQWQLLSPVNAGYVYLPIVGVYLGIYFAVDMRLPSHVVRWVISPYIVTIFALVQMVLNTRGQADYFPLLGAGVVLAYTCTLTVLKVAISIGTRNNDTASKLRLDSCRRCTDSARGRLLLLQLNYTNNKYGVYLLVEYAGTVVYALQLAWLVYSTELVVTRTGLGPLYARPTVLPISVFFVFYAATGITTRWLHLWTTPNLHRYTPLCMLGANACAYVTLAIAVNALRKHGPALLEVGARQQVTSFVPFVVNDVIILRLDHHLLLWSALSVTVQ